MELNTIFDKCIDNIITKNKSIYFVGKPISNTITILCVDDKTNEVYTYSNEWLFLIKKYYPSSSDIYNEVVATYNNITANKKLDLSYTNDNVIPFITSFSKGTIHGYSGLFYILNEYIKNIDQYKNYKIIVYKDSQQGLLDIVEYFVSKSILTNIIYISSDIQYLFNSVFFIPNKWHMYPHTFDTNFELNKLIDKYIVNENTNTKTNENICIIKSTTSDNRTTDGVVDINVINAFCSKNNLYFIEPTKYNEIELIRIINNAKLLVLSWGTVFLKNYIYISDKCEKIIVLIHSDFIPQYNGLVNNNEIVKKWKNADVIYHTTDKNLNVDILNTTSIHGGSIKTRSKPIYPKYWRSFTSTKKKKRYLRRKKSLRQLRTKK
jgi:hypothetical protein